MVRTRPNDFCRIELEGNTLRIKTRSDTGRGVRFGSAQNVSIRDEEVEALYELLKDHYDPADDE